MLNKYRSCNGVGRGPSCPTIIEWPTRDEGPQINECDAPSLDPTYVDGAFIEIPYDITNGEYDWVNERWPL